MKPEASTEDEYLAELKRKATVSMDMLDKARRLAQVYQDYYDGHQWTGDEKRILEGRNQPALTFNHIKPAVNAIIGIVERGKTDPKAWGRTPKDNDAAEVATDGLRYVADASRFNVKRRDCFKDFLVWGYCAGVLEMTQDGDVTLKRIRPEEFFYDPYSRDNDFGDARYMGLAKWMDEADLRDLYPDRIDQISLTFDVAPGGDTFRDRPKDGWSWVDVRARRLMVFEMYKRRGAAWEKCVFVAGGILESGPSPFMDMRSQAPRNPIVAQSAYVDMDNQRYGVVKDMLGPQDAINKARSKAVHILNVSKLRVDPGLLDIDSVRREWAKPDGIIEARDGQIQELGDRMLAPAHLQLLADAKDEMRRQSPTPGIVGRGSGQSGRAILAEQQAGLTEQAPLLAQFDDWTLRCYRGFWACIQQFWTGPKWIRVTDDEQAPRFIGLNVPEPVVDPMTGQPAIDPMTGQPAMQVQNSPAEMDVDIVIDSTPDTAVIQEEQFQRLAELAQAGMPISPDVLIEASSLPKKRQIMDKLRQAQEQQAQAPNPQAQALEAEQAKVMMTLQAKEREAQLDDAKHAQQLQRQDEMDQVRHARALELARMQFVADRQTHVNKIRETAIKASTRRSPTMPGVEGDEGDDGIDYMTPGEQAMVQAQRQTAEIIAATQAQTAELMAQNAAVMAQAASGIQQAAAAIAQVAQVMAAPKRLVKDPRTGEKRVEIMAQRMN
jgi:hypothetical protein